VVRFQSTASILLFEINVNIYISVVEYNTHQLPCQHVCNTTVTPCKIQKCLTTSVVNFSAYLCVAASHFHLFTTQRFKHTVHVLLLTYIPSSLTPVQPVTYIQLSTFQITQVLLQFYFNDLGMVGRSIQGHGKAHYTLHAAHSLCMSSFVLKLKPKQVDIHAMQSIAHSTKLLSMRIPSTCEMYQVVIVDVVCPFFQWYNLPWLMHHGGVHHCLCSQK